MLPTHSSRTQVVVTGLGLATPLGLGRDSFWSALESGRSGIVPISAFDTSALPVHLMGQVRDFDPLEWVKPRKSLKVMSRDSQLGLTVAELARQDAGLEREMADPHRTGIIFGAENAVSPLDETAAAYQACFVDGKFDVRLWGTRGLSAMFPLGMLRLLPNMIPCHISIAHDLRGPNNTIYNSDLSSLLAIEEAARVIQRGWADVMLAGGVSSKVHPCDWVHRAMIGELCPETEAATACRPFDATRAGQVYGEGAAVLILESRRHAEARHANILARIAGAASACIPQDADPARPGRALRQAIVAALAEADLQPADIGHINANGVGTRAGDRVEAQALAELFPRTPVTAFKSYFGNLDAGTGAVELAASILALKEGRVPPTLNYRHPDPECPLNVVHDGLLPTQTPTALSVNYLPFGQAVAMVLVRD